MKKIVLFIIMSTLLLLGACSSDKMSVGKPHDSIQNTTHTAGFIKQFAKPVIQPTGSGYESRRTYNPAFAILDGKLYMVYRAEGENTGTGVFCLAEAKSPLSFVRYEKNPVMRPDKDYDKLGCEDPRIVQFGKKYYMYYVNNNSTSPAQISAASSEDLINWTKFGPIMKPKYNWELDKIKAPAPIPVKIGGKYFMYFLGQDKPWQTKIGLAVSDNLKQWEEASPEPVVKPRKGHFDSKGVEPGVCVEIPNTDYLLLIYDGWDETLTNKAGWIVFDKNNPEKILARSEEPIISIDNKHIFACAMIQYNGKWYIYWGADDREVHGGEFMMDEFLKIVNKKINK